MYEFHLFAGIGGGILGGLLNGNITIGAIEIEEYPRKVLIQRQLDGCLPVFPVWDDVRTFREDNSECRWFIDYLRSIRDGLQICGGFPCQDISIAGKGEGLEGARSGLWTEFRRIVCEIRPRNVFIENSPMLTVRGGTRVIADLAAMGYSAQWGIVSAQTFGAWHRRDRFWCMAEREREREIHNAIGKRCEVDHLQAGDASDGEAAETFSCFIMGGRCAEDGNISNTESRGDVRGGWRERYAEHASAKGVSSEGRKVQHAVEQWWNAEPGLGRVAYGVANRVDRLKAIGNAQVPIVAAAAEFVLEVEE